MDRKLTSGEIKQLQNQSCLADDWNNISVSDGFTAGNIFHTRFSGKIRLGRFDKNFTLPGGLKKQAGLRHVTLHNCTLGDNVLIENIPNYIANYDIGDECFIQNVNNILVEGISSFGNGTEVSVLNETGGREVPIYNKLSAHTAYIIAMYRHRPELINKLRFHINQYTENIKSATGKIGKGVFILNTGTIKNMFIGNNCYIDGASRLENGSINSNEHAPVHIGHNVMAEDFIISSGAHVSDGVVLSRCFIGQACNLSHLFSAHDSLFFSNCQGENGEACAIFAGPYTVSMHKSSLLIAGMFSFLNAGSGSNQSNHMYKLGPIHQGIAERGSKTTSDSYILWPARIGAFSLVMGRHVTHPDTSNLPFSYLIEKRNKSFLVPGVNLRSVGTIRDAQKWPKRDKRKDPEKLDNINFNLLSPFTIQKMLNGIDTLRELQNTSGETSESYSYQSTIIRNSSLVKGIQFYTLAINKFMGNSIIKRLENIRFSNNEEIRLRLQPTHPYGLGEWVDLSGLITPKQLVSQLAESIEDGLVNDLSLIEESFSRWHKDYYDMEWTWVCDLIPRWYGISVEEITAKDITDIVRQWKDAVVTLDKMLYEDAHKEYSLVSKTGFGADGNSKQREYDFEQVRGAFEKDPFVCMVSEHIRIKTELGNELIDRIAPLLD